MAEPLRSALKGHPTAAATAALVGAVAIVQLLLAVASGAANAVMVAAIAMGAVLTASLLPAAQRTTQTLRTRWRDAGLSDLVADVERGLAAHEFELHYQPITRLATAEVEMAEALVRWRRADGAFLSPGRFVPRIEDDPVFWQLTLALIDRVLAESKHWSSLGRPVDVAVNISSATLVDERLPAELDRLLSEHRFSPSRLELEVTEGAIMRDAQLAARVLCDIRDLGVARISIDDFGMGYSSLGRLRDLPVNAVKLDRSFVAELAASGDSTLVKSIIELAHGLGMTVTAEGVEHPETWQTLARLGCDHAQGFWIARPAPPRVFGAWLRDFSPGPYAALSAIGDRREGPGRREADVVAAPRLGVD
ncbi:MAG: EAL domain-containing protein [Thermoleophilaceae bacterium]